MIWRWILFHLPLHYCQKWVTYKLGSYVISQWTDIMWLCQTWFLSIEYICHWVIQHQALYMNISHENYIFRLYMFLRKQYNAKCVWLNSLAIIWVFLCRKWGQLSQQLKKWTHRMLLFVQSIVCSVITYLHFYS